MTITTSCPGCKSLFRLSETLAGKQVRCLRCANLFQVPLVLGAGEAAPVTLVSEPAPAVVEPPPEAAAPPVTEPAAPEPEEILLEAKLVEPVEAKKEAAPIAPLPAEAPPSALWLTGALLLFVVGILVTGGIAGLWVGTHLDSPARAMIVAPFRGVAKKDDLRFDQFGKVPEIFDDKDAGRLDPQPTRIVVHNGKASVARFLQWPNVIGGRFGNDGPFLLYRLHLEEGKTYNFLVTANNTAPRLQIYDGDQEVKSAFGVFPAGRVLLSYRAQRTGDHLFFITAQNRQAVNVSFQVAPENPSPAVNIKLDLKGNATRNDALILEDAVDAAEKDLGPYQDYVVRFEAGKSYRLKVHGAPYLPVARIYDGDRCEHDLRADFITRAVDFTYQPKRTGEYRIRVTSEAFALGVYTLEIATQKK